MEEIRKQVIENETLLMDGKNFIECTITNCTLIFSGGDYAWTDTEFDMCILQFVGEAARTISFLGYFGKLDSEFANELKIPTGRGLSPSPLLLEIEKAREVMLKLKADLILIYLTNQNPLIEAGITAINRYFTPEAAGSASGSGQVGL